MMRRWSLALALLACATTARAQRPCDRAAAAPLTEQGWAAYRRGAVAEADALFRRALLACPGDLAATTGHGYVALRQDRLDSARVRFARALAADSTDHDALMGAGLAAWRANDLPRARWAFTGVLARTPTDAEARAYLARIPTPVDASQLPGRARPATLDLVSRTGPRRFEVRRGDTWEPLWIKAVNLGAALPGKHPAEFPPNDSTYDAWIALTARMGANTIRVYTVHPPHFYSALDRWNRTHPDSVVWLIHGVWTELPPGRLEERYDDSTWARAFAQEARDVVDLLHGNAALQPRPGHASGLYAVDVSPWVLGYIIGREWEPYSVEAYTKLHPGARDWRGRYVEITQGNALEVWMGRFTEAMIAHEMDRYHAQRPIAYTNWPTLDPLTHPTESSRTEEAAWLQRRGVVAPEASKEYDNDVIALDATRWRATTEFPAGVFASYHAYPYYPDFMNLDPGYATAQSPWGASHYFGYLRELVEYHGTMPVVISEYGVPSSRGNAHRQPQGFDHGGHDEAAQARINARLTREIHAAGAAGAGLFAVIDEWFKKNWLVIDFELPAERNRLWLNPLDAEQNYGIVAMRPGVRDSAITIDGDTADWHGRPPLIRATDATAPVRALHVHHDEAYVYLRLTVDSLDWARRHYLIGIDTYDRQRGDALLPYTRAAAGSGLEFVVDLRGPNDARVLVDRPYNLYRLTPIRNAKPAAVQAVFNRPFRTEANRDGLYDTLWTVPNRRRLGRDGTVFPEQRDDRNRLRHATQGETTLADWYSNAATRTIELRIPWGMLHVTDPSSRQVLFGRPNARDPESVTTDGFRFVVQSNDPSRPADAAPPLVASNLWQWPTWEEPRWYAEVKPLFAAMRDVFREIGR